jgi:hypothetical protein
MMFEAGPTFFQIRQMTMQINRQEGPKKPFSDDAQGKPSP